MSDLDDAQEFAFDVKHVRVAAEYFLTKHFGKRCKDFDPDCEGCKRWKLLDELTENPFCVNTCST